MEITLTQCVTCGAVLPETAEHFEWRQDTQKFRSSCRTCMRSARQAKYLRNAEQVKEKARIYRFEHRNELKERERLRSIRRAPYRKIYNHNYYLKNKGALNQYSRNYRINHAQELAEYEHKRKARRKIERRAYYKAHPEAARQARLHRRAKLRKAEGKHTSNDIRLLLKGQTDKRGDLHCWWCGEVIPDKKYHVDHKQPLARGGSNSVGNLCIACPACNTRKKTKLPSEFNGRLL